MCSFSCFHDTVFLICSFEQSREDLRQIFWCITFFQQRTELFGAHESTGCYCEEHNNRNSKFFNCCDGEARETIHDMLHENLRSTVGICCISIDFVEDVTKWRQEVLINGNMESTLAAMSCMESESELGGKPSGMASN